MHQVIGVGNFCSTKMVGGVFESSMQICCALRLSIVCNIGIIYALVISRWKWGRGVVNIVLVSMETLTGSCVVSYEYRAFLKVLSIWIMLFMSIGKYISRSFILVNELGGGEDMKYGEFVWFGYGGLSVCLIIVTTLICVTNAGS